MAMPSKALFIGLTMLAFATGLCSQGVEVKNVRFKQVKGSKVVVDYDLLGDASKKYMITLSLFRPDTKETVPLNRKNLFGDIGNNVRAGRGKKIVWDLLKDFPRGLHNEGFVFTIDADAQKGGSKLPWIAGGVAAIGGLIVLVTDLDNWSIGNGRKYSIAAGTSMNEKVAAMTIQPSRFRKRLKIAKVAFSLLVIW